jgi:Calcineurin-like phosphoesterase
MSSPQSAYSTKRLQMRPIVDPRAGDVEDDASSTKSRSLLSLAGSLLVEISLPKLAVAWLLLVIVPALALGMVPLIVSAWVAKVSSDLSSPIRGLWPILLLGLLFALAWYAGRTLYRLAETGFWALNSLVVEPGYVTCRELLRHFAEALFPSEMKDVQFAKLRAATAVVAALIVSALALGILALVWPRSHWTFKLSDFTTPYQLAGTALANSVVLVAGYFAAASLVWGIADASMAQPRDLDRFDSCPRQERTWRIAHLSDIHVVGERYGFRIESGRAGPRGNARLRQAMTHLEALCEKQQLDLILVTGDMTDAGTSAEWAELLDLLALHPRLAERTLVLPGNHDLNIVDRTNPARIDTPVSPKTRLRKVRALSAINALQGERVHIVDRDKEQLGCTLAQSLQPHYAGIARFADVARPRLSNSLARLWNEVFPMVFLPDSADGLGVILLNSNADTHFSFTNALGMIATEQMKGIKIAMAQYPQACWIVALHHHVVEYPKAATALSDRIGTALINGNWFVRQLQRFSDRVIVMHGHRHTDWIGKCADLLIVSAPSPVMEATDSLDTYFWIHTVAVGPDGRLSLLAPERISLPGQPNGDRA